MLSSAIAFARQRYPAVVYTYALRDEAAILCGDVTGEGVKSIAIEG